MKTWASIFVMAVIQNFPSNSHKSKDGDKEEESESKTKAVVSGNVTKQTKKKHSFLAGDIHDAGAYVLSDVIVPALKNLLYDSISKGMSEVIFGEDRSPSRHNGTRFNYNSISRRDDDDRVVRRPARSSTYDYSDLSFDSKEDAERVLETMCDIMDQFNYVSVGDMYDAAGQQTMSTDFDWGWTSLRSASVQRDREGYYYICIGRPIALSRR